MRCLSSVVTSACASSGANPVPIEVVPEVTTAGARRCERCDPDRERSSFLSSIPELPTLSNVGDERGGSDGGALEGGW
jgi:hypothetical protein